MEQPPIQGDKLFEFIRENADQQIQEPLNNENENQFEKNEVENQTIQNVELQRNKTDDENNEMEGVEENQTIQNVELQRNKTDDEINEMEGVEENQTIQNVEVQRNKTDDEINEMDRVEEKTIQKVELQENKEMHKKVSKYIEDISNVVQMTHQQKSKSFMSKLKNKAINLQQEVEVQTQQQELSQESNQVHKLKNLIQKAPIVISTQNLYKFDRFKKSLKDKADKKQRLKTPPAIAKVIVVQDEISNDEILKISESEKFFDNLDEVQKKGLEIYLENQNQQQGIQNEQSYMSAFINKEEEQLHVSFEKNEQVEKPQESRRSEIEFLGEYKVPTGFQMQGEEEITSILQVKTAQQDQTVSEGEASQIIQLIHQPEFNVEGKPGRTPKRSKFQQVLQDEEQLQSSLNKKERLKNILQEELSQVSHEIRELRALRKVKEKSPAKKQYYPTSNQIKNMIKISDDQQALYRANELVARMNQERRDRRLRQQREYNYIEAMFRDEIDKLRKEQDEVHVKMENDRKFKIQRRVNDYHKRQLEFAQMQQANQQFIKDLMNRGPQEGQLAQLLEDKIQKIRGDPKNGSIIHLPSISSKRGETLFKLQSESVEYPQPKKEHRQLRAKLPRVAPEISKSLLQVEVERAMIEKYKQSRENLIQQHLQSQNDYYDDNE